VLIIMTAKLLDFEKTDKISWPRISIVTPRYNRVKLNDETILSVLSQDYPNLE
jgi:cellulose synthase/poly-beta-1,6-N-acetylglucosamine synthase-like glycosyltransferase